MIELMNEWMNQWMNQMYKENWLKDGSQRTLKIKISELWSSFYYDFGQLVSLSD